MPKTSRRAEGRQRLLTAALLVAACGADDAGADATGQGDRDAGAAVPFGRPQVPDFSVAWPGLDDAPDASDASADASTDASTNADTSTSADASMGAGDAGTSADDASASPLPCGAPEAPLVPREVTVRVGDLLDGGRAVAGAEIRSCRADDASCAAPRAVTYTDAAGRAVLTAPFAGARLDGYLLARDGGLVPARVDRLYVPAGRGSVDVPLPTRVALEAFVRANSYELTPGRGRLIVAVVRCDGAPDDGQVVQVRPAGASTTQTPNAFPEPGLAIALNLVPGPWWASASADATEPLGALPVEPTVVRADEVALVYVAQQ